METPSANHGNAFRVWISALLLLGIGSTVAFLACASDEGDEPNLILIVVDTLRQDRLGCFGYEGRRTSPAIDRMARQSVVVEGFTSVSSWTMPSMASLFTGLPPAEHRVSRLFDVLDEPETLAARLSRAGYATGCVMTNFLLPITWRGRRTGFAEGFDFYDDDLARRPAPHSGSTSEPAVDSALSWLDRRTEGQPWFLTLHLFDPHIVYEEHDAYGFADTDYEGWVEGGLARSVLREHQARCTDADRRQLDAIYDSEVRATDAALGRLFEALRARPDWERTIVVFTSDHGEELAERDYIGHTSTLHHELIDLPLVVRLPGDQQAGTRVPARLPQVDLYPTLLELCGLESDRGRSFAPILRGNAPVADRACFSEVDFIPANPEYRDKQTRKRSLIADGYKLIHDLARDRWSLYELATDATERQDLAGDPDFAERLQNMQARLRAHPWFESGE